MFAIFWLYILVYLGYQLDVSQKSHERALKLTDFWITGLLFDLNHKFINGSLAFSPG